MKKMFITFEGGEGSGKTTIINRLMQELKDKNIKAFQSREPGGSKISEEIRKIILSVDNTKMDYVTEALLYAASRRQHLEEVIKPALEEGYLVICDRYVDSSLAYQGYARGLGIDEVYNLNYYATGGLLPDLTIFIDVNPEEGIARISKNNRDKDRLDLETLAFHHRVREGYLQLVKRFPERIKRIDGNKNIEELYSEIRKVIFENL
ncbi:MAG TPA: dTMP kinase [Bacilli bacterium]|jgi:dTMP kinase|nr:dTMP kinase [Bacilli bacterium]HOD61124.1 dTMP kinase [Bacilli bacterium]